MAPLPVSNTARYFVDYQQGTHEHTLVARATGATSPASFGSIINGFLLNLTTLLVATTLTRVRFAAQGSTVSNPVITGFEGSSYGSGAPTNEQNAIYLDFVGRSSGGRRVRLAVFGYKGTFSDFRLTEAESAPIANAVASLNAPSTCFLAIDGIDPTWYPYANTGANAYWQRNLRV